MSEQPSSNDLVSELRARREFVKDGGFSYSYELMGRAADEIERLQRDVVAYQGALGHGLPSWHDGKLSDGTDPVNALANTIQKYGPFRLTHEPVPASKDQLINRIERHMRVNSKGSEWLITDPAHLLTMNLLNGAFLLLKGLDNEPPVSRFDGELLPAGDPHFRRIAPHPGRRDPYANAPLTGPGSRLEAQLQDVRNNQREAANFAYDSAMGTSPPPVSRDILNEVLNVVIDHAGYSNNTTSRQKYLDDLVTRFEDAIDRVTPTKGAAT